MVKFYDPADVAEQAVVEGLLRKAGIEYFLNLQEGTNNGPAQILVAEEDLPHAEQVLAEAHAPKRTT
jgi:hypothetical protein